MIKVKFRVQGSSSFKNSHRKISSYSVLLLCFIWYNKKRCMRSHDSPDVFCCPYTLYFVIIACHYFFPTIKSFTHIKLYKWYDHRCGKDRPQILYWNMHSYSPYSSVLRGGGCLFINALSFRTNVVVWWSGDFFILKNECSVASYIWIIIIIILGNKLCQSRCQWFPLNADTTAKKYLTLEKVWSSCRQIIIMFPLMSFWIKFEYLENLITI